MHAQPSPASPPASRRLRQLPQLLCLLLLLNSGAAAGSSEETLPASLSRALAQHGIPADAISLWVRPLGAEQPLLAHRPDTPRVPGSAIKLLTSYAALETLGPAYTWRTELYSDGPIEDGVLKGDLWLKGYGDAYLVLEEFWKLTGALRRTGIRHIAGDLRFDTSHFALAAEDPSAFDNQPHRAYNQAPHPLLVNFNALQFELEPDLQGQGVRVKSAPQLPGLAVENRLRLREGRCTGFQRGVNYQVLEEAPAARRVVFEGQYPTGCDTFRLIRTALPPEEYTYQLFRKYWGQWGGTLEGGWRAGTLPDADAEPLLVHYSRPLGDLIRLANKFSNNVMTRHFKLTLGAEVYGAPATVAKGHAAILALLEAQNIDTAGLVLENAAGLSRANRITARQLAALLERARQSRFMPEFVSSLALAGYDGTLQRRFEQAPEAGHMHLKTGTLDHVSAVAGYVRTANGQDLIVALIINAENVHRGSGEAIQDTLLRWAFAQ